MHHHHGLKRARRSAPARCEPAPRPHRMRGAPGPRARCLPRASPLAGEAYGSKSRSICAPGPAHYTPARPHQLPRAGRARAWAGRPAPWACCGCARRPWSYFHRPRRAPSPAPWRRPPAARRAPSAAPLARCVLPWSHFHHPRGCGSRAALLFRLLFSRSRAVETALRAGGAQGGFPAGHPAAASATAQAAAPAPPRSPSGRDAAAGRAPKAPGRAPKAAGAG
mgnify:CR=1 FL=1